MAPLHVLAFLLPLIVLYEIGSFWFLQDASGMMRTVGARNLLVRFFEIFGATSFHLPAITLVVVLLLWHVLAHDSWRIQPGVLMGMAFESTVLVLPLLVLGLVVYRQLQGGSMSALQGTTLPQLRAAAWQDRLTLSIGAGLYEELVFRLLLITGIHFALADVMRVGRTAAAVVACIVSALAFAFYHDITLAGLSDGSDLRKLLFLTIAGLYFGGLFLVRGFGIVVGTHAIYDAVVLVAIAGQS